MLTNERMLYSHQQQEQCVHCLALLWDIWMTIWLGDYMVAYHELSLSRRASGLSLLALISSCISMKQ